MNIIPMNNHQSLHRSNLRQLIFAVLPLDSDLNALCGDFFPDVSLRMSMSMDRVAKVNLLLDLETGSRILAALKQHAPERYAKYAHGLDESSLVGSVQDLNQISTQANTLHSTQLIVARLPFIIIGVGLLLFFIAAFAPRMTPSTYKTVFVSLGALAGLYLIFGLFFANIAMFPERQRSRIVVFLVSALVLTTLILTVYAARSYYLLSGQLPVNEVPQPNPTPGFSQATADMDAVDSDLSSRNGDMHKPRDTRKTPPHVETQIVDLAMPPLADMVKAYPVEDIHPVVPIQDGGEIESETLIHDDIINEETPHLPDSVKSKFVCQDVTGTYLICVNESGIVTDAKSLVGIPNSADADLAILNSLKKWKYKPRDKSICVKREIVFSIENDNGCRDIPNSKVNQLIKKQKISRNDDPRLSDEAKRILRGRTMVCSYRVCIGESGGIESVDTVKSIDKAISLYGEDEKIKSVITKWRYKPQPNKICFVQFFEFQVTD